MMSRHYDKISGIQIWLGIEDREILDNITVIDAAYELYCDTLFCYVEESNEDITIDIMSKEDFTDYMRSETSYKM